MRKGSDPRLLPVQQDFADGRRKSLTITCPADMLCGGAGSGAHSTNQARVYDTPSHSMHQSSNVSDRNNEAVLAVLDKLLSADHIGYNRWDPAGHCLRNHHPEGIEA